MAVDYSLNATHAVAFPSKLQAASGSPFIFNITLTEDLDNGTLIGKGDWLSFNNYEQDDAPGSGAAFAGVIQEQAADGNWYVEVTSVDPITPTLLVYQDPILPTNWTNEFQSLKAFYNEEGDVVRAYQLAPHDIFELSAEGFDGTPSKGKAVSVDNGKLKVAD